jgi:hypothetical protein
VRYRLRSANGESQTLTLDSQGRTSSPTIAARMDVDEGTRRDCEHFLRRVVRGVFAA